MQIRDTQTVHPPENLSALWHKYQRTKIIDILNRGLHKHSPYKLIHETGYEWNKKVGLHFDNEHEESISEKD